MARLQTPPSVTLNGAAAMPTTGYNATRAPSSTHQPSHSEREHSSGKFTALKCVTKMPQQALARMPGASSHRSGPAARKAGENKMRINGVLTSNRASTAAAVTTKTSRRHCATKACIRCASSAGALPWLLARAARRGRSAWPTEWEMIVKPNISALATAKSPISALLARSPSTTMPKCGPRPKRILAKWNFRP